MSSRNGRSLLRGPVTSGIVATLVVTLVLSGCELAMGAPRAESQASDISAATYTPRPTREATPQPTPEPTLPEWLNRMPSRECVTPPPDLMTVIFQADPVGCYGNADLAVEGIVYPIGVYDPYLLAEPAWLGLPRWTLEAIVDEASAPFITLATYDGGVARPSTWSGPDLWIVADPATGIDLGDYDGQVVGVIGHFDDPVAETCRYTEDYSDLDVSPKDAVESCRTTFVVTRIDR